MDHEYDSTTTPEFGNYGIGRLIKVTDLSGGTAFQYNKPAIQRISAPLPARLPHHLNMPTFFVRQS